MPTQFITKPRRPTKIRDTSSRAKKNPRRNPDTVTLRVPLSVHSEFQYLAVDGYEDGDPSYSPDRVAFVEASRSARRAGKTYTYTLDPLALAYLPVVVSDGIEFAHNRQYGERDPSARARNRNLIKNLQRVLADARAGGTKIKPPKPATPSVTTLQDILDIEPNKARNLKAAMDAGFLPPAEVLGMAARYMGGFGVQSRDGLFYVVMSDAHPKTLAYVHDKGRYLVVANTTAGLRKAVTASRTDA